MKKNNPDCNINSRHKAPSGKSHVDSHVRKNHDGTLSYIPCHNRKK